MCVQMCVHKNKPPLIAGVYKELSGETGIRTLATLTRWQISNLLHYHSGTSPNWKVKIVDPVKYPIFWLTLFWVFNSKLVNINKFFVQNFFNNFYFRKGNVWRVKLLFRHLSINYFIDKKFQIIQTWGF